MIENLFDKLGAPFKKGGPLEKYYPAFQAGETIFLTPGLVTKSGPHIRDQVDLKRFMIMVVVAITPCALLGVINTGYQSIAYYNAIMTPVTGITVDMNPINIVAQGLARFLPLYIVTLAAGGAIEAIFAVIRKHEINEGFLVTSMLFPLTLPPTTPLWMAAVGIIFGVFIGKEIFGGTGMNIFNPALTARAFLFFAYPAAMSGATNVWVASPIDFGSLSELTIDFTRIASMEAVDGISGATPLGAAYNNTLASSYDGFSMFVGLIPGSIGETSALMAIAGAGLLIVTGIGSLKTMVGCVVGAVVTASIFKVFSDPATSGELLTMNPLNHLIMGGFAFGAVYMATDPVSSPATAKGKLVYGILIGALCVLIRNINPAYPEGMMLAILFMNLFAPLIDHYVIEAQIKRRFARG